MRALWVTISLITPFVMGCAAAYHVGTYTTDDGVVVTHLRGNKIFVEGGGKYYLQENPAGIPSMRGELCTLDVERHTDSRGNVTYFLLLEYVGSNWLNMERGRSLTLMVNRRKTFVLSGHSDVNRSKDMGAGTMTESLDYKVSADFLRNLAAASQVDITISGGNGELRGYFVDNNFTSLRRFVNEFVLTDS